MQQLLAVDPLSAFQEVSFAGFRLKFDGTLLRGDAPIHLPPKELSALQFLVANAGRIVTADELRRGLWGDVHVTADSVPKCVSSLRAHLEPADCIQTIYKRGYRFVAEVLVPREPDAPQRLAILPFTAANGVPDYLGPAVAEETMAWLARACPAAFSILARDSVLTLSRRGLSACEIGRMLRAGNVLAGSVNALPLHYRLRVEMIRVHDGVQVWVEDVLVDRAITAGLETELARRLAFRLSAAFAARGVSTQSGLKTAGFSQPEVSAGNGLCISAAAGEPGENHEAYDTFQRAHHEWQTLQRHRMQDGLQHLFRAIELNPTLAGARIDVVNLCVTQCFCGFMAPAAEAGVVRRATEVVPDLPAHDPAILPALGWIRFHFDRDLASALQFFSQSEHVPHDAWVTRARSMFALSRHRFQEATDLLRSAIRLDPYSPWLHARLAWALHLAGEAKQSAEQIRTALDQFPDHEGACLYGTMILAYIGDTAQAVELARELTQRLPHFDLATAAYAYAQACAGQKKEASATLERMEWLSRERYLLKTLMPAAYLALGDTASAIAGLRTANESRCPWFFQTLADPRLNELHGNAGFEQMRSILTEMEAAVEC